jgi:hypothetical protein
MDNMEGVKLLLSKLRRKGFPHEIEAMIKYVPSRLLLIVIIRVLPLLLVDLFNMEQALSLIFGEFVKHLSQGCPELLAMVIHKVRLSAVDNVHVISRSLQLLEREDNMRLSTHGLSFV